MGILNNNIKKLIDKIARKDAELKVDVGNKNNLLADIKTEVQAMGAKLNLVSAINALFRNHGAGINDSDSGSSKAHETFSKEKILSIFRKQKEDIEKQKILDSGQNAIANSNFDVWGSGAPRFFEPFNTENNRTTALTFIRTYDVGIDKSSSVRVRWTTPMDTPKGLGYAPSSFLAMEKDTWYIVAIAARIPEGYTGQSRMELHHTRDPQFSEFEYISQPVLEPGKWTWTIARFKKPNVADGDFTRVLFTIDKAYTGTEYEISSPYLSKGYYWSGYKNESNSNEIRDIRTLATRVYGVENLIPDSGMLMGYINTNGTVSETASYKDMVTDFIPVKPAYDYRYQAWVNVTASGGNPHTLYQWYNAEYQQIGARISYGPKITSSTFPYEANYQIAMRAPAGAAFLRISTRWMANQGSKHKLERGQMYTDWSMSSEDVQKRLDQIPNPNILPDPEFLEHEPWGTKSVIQMRRDLVDYKGRTALRIQSFDGQAGIIGVNTGPKHRSMRIVQGKKYTLSFYAYASEYTDLNYTYIMRADGSNKIISQSTMLSVDENRSLKKLTFVAPFSSMQAYILIGLRKASFDPDYFIEIDSVKVEEGEFATPWVDNPINLSSTIISKQFIGYKPEDSSTESYIGKKPRDIFHLMQDGLLVEMKDNSNGNIYYQKVLRKEPYNCFYIGEQDETHAWIYCDTRFRGYFYKNHKYTTEEERRQANPKQVWHTDISPEPVEGSNKFLGRFPVAKARLPYINISGQYYNELNEDWTGIYQEYNSHLRSVLIGFSLESDGTYKMFTDVN